MKFVLTKASIDVDGTDLSKRASQVTVTREDDEVDMTTMQSAMKETDRGLGDASMMFNFFQDFEASQTDAVLWPLSESGDKFICVVKPFDGEPSATNPAYVMGGKLFGYTPIAGSVGEASTTESTIKNSTDLGIKKAESEVELTEFTEEIEAAF